MWYKSWKPRSTARRSAASKKLRCYTDPLIYAVQRRGLSRTQSRTSSTRSVTECSSSDGSSSHDRISTCSSIFNSLNRNVSRKRKSLTAEPEEGPSKRRRESSDSAEGHINSSCGCFSDRLTISGDKAMFETKYRTENLLGGGAFGLVYAGYRREDNLPVAIKYVSHSVTDYAQLLVDGEIKEVPLEVALLCKANPAASKTSPVVALLDWYDDERNLILVMERPVPCCDLFKYVGARESAITEEEAKLIAKQLVDAGIELHSRGVFHADIKTDNILIEFGSEDPRVRMIDFGCSMFIKDKTCPAQLEANENTFFLWRTEQKAEPKTVGQLGAVIFDMLFRHREDPKDLSSDCRDFLKRCQSATATQSVSLASLRDHPWLV